MRSNQAFDMQGFEELPASLKEVFVKELHKRLTMETGLRRITFLLALAYCKSLGYIIEGDDRHDFMLEAARLGSYMAKRGALTLFEAKQVNLDIHPQEHLEWLYDILLAQMPSRRQLMDRATESIPGILLHTKVLGKVFESECLRPRVIL